MTAVSRPVRRAALLSAAAGTALVLAAAPAGATVVVGTTGLGNTTLRLAGDSDPDSFTLGCAGGSVTKNFVAVAPAISCAPLTEVEVDDYGGSDTWNLGSVGPATFPAVKVVYASLDDQAPDTYTGSALPDLVTGDSGDTGDIVATGDGDDQVNGAKTADGGAGDDYLANVTGSVQGGPGDDVIVNPLSGPLDGGAGSDTLVLDLASLTQGLTPVHFQIADGAITAFNPDFGTIVTPMSSIETVEVVSLDGPNADIEDTSAYTGRMVVRMMGGDDTFTGGSGADHVDAGPGNDTVNPGGGSDQVFAGSGNDTVNVRDGVADYVDCGDGTDTVTADRLDTLVNCENVSLPAPDTDKIAGPKKVVQGAKATFTFTSPVAGATFECAVDKGAFKACRSPFKLSTKKLKAGKHTLLVRAVQPAANADQTPSSLRFKVTAPPRH